VAGSHADRRLVADIRSAYEGGVEGWATGPAGLYRRLADALVATAPGSLAGQRVLDLGAGTGVASEALVAAGASPVGVDLAHAMLAHRRAHRPPGVVGDAAALPLHARAFDAVVAAFSLNHVPDLQAALAECRRVTRSGGLILASTFPSDDEHPAKAAVESVLDQFGYQRPEWYETFKARIAGRTGDPGAFAQSATTAGLVDTQVVRLEVDAGLDDPAVAAAWRLNMPHTIGFVAGLDPPRRATLRTRVIAALPAGLPASMPILVLHARVT
jgi:SAM-dependent methyltransferase